MRTDEHAKNSQIRAGIRAEEIHKWIDGFFDAESFEGFLRSGDRRNYNPYNHRKYRHCIEALDDAYAEFEGSYSREQIKAVFESHLLDDYNGYLPRQRDFENGTFVEKYHDVEAVDDLEKIFSEAELSEYFRDRRDSREARDRALRLSTGFYWRIVWPTVIAFVLFAASAFTIIVPVFRKAMMREKKLMIRELTATAASAIDFYIHQSQAGKMDVEMAQQQAAAELSELRYGVDGKDYFWITDMQPRMVMHPYRPELIGQDLTNYKDAADKSGTRLFVEFVDLVKAENEGYLEYQWQWMDDTTHSEPKLSYVKGIPEWGWIIGTGIYIHDIEDEMARLSRNLLLADGVIALALFGILVNIVFQSRRMEIHRKRAEDGLREAKDRYRALVESSNEGYVLEVSGETVYSNRMLQRMSGYGEAELADMPLWDLFDPERSENKRVIEYLRQLYSGSTESVEREGKLRTKEGGELDVLVSASRMFFSEKNGHVITFSRIVRGAHEAISDLYRHSTAVQHSAVASESVQHGELAERIRQCETSGQVIRMLKLLPVMVQSMTARGVRAALLREKIGGVYDAAVRRLIEHVLADLPEPPVPFAFLSLGSNARHDMTLFADQDNALVFTDVDGDRLMETRRWFLQLADGVCSRLNQAGYPYCSGGIMAANPKWCLTLSEWKRHFQGWILDATPESILEMNVFLDVRCSYGDDALVQRLGNTTRLLVEQNPEFLMHYARNCLLSKVPLGIFGKLRAEKKGDRKTINVKECLKPIETFARIYALKHGITVPGTLDRLRQLERSGYLQKETFREMSFVLDYLWQLRFYNQILASQEIGSAPDDLNVEALTEIERENLKTVLARIPLFQTRLSYDFLGMAP